MVNKQIARALDRLHQQQVRPGTVCWWHYDNLKDEYFCDCGLRLPGKGVIDSISNYFPNRKED